MTRIVAGLGELNGGKKVYAIFVLCAATAISLPAQTFTTLFSFDGNEIGSTDGYDPYFGALVQATNGDFYGTTIGGGTGGWGTLFKITPSGVLTTLYNFCYPTCAVSGGMPWAGLLQARNGDLYGTTPSGGENGVCPGLGCGTVYKITPGGSLTTLYTFCSQSGCTDGSGPNGGLVQATNGDLYGMSRGGGANNGGTVFKITSSGTLTTLYSFCSQSGCTDGSGPYAGLIQATDGNLYGTTESGGSSNGYGTVFKITPGGSLTTLYTFCSQSGCTDGAVPFSGLVQATNREFYGTTLEGGANNGGTVYKITSSGTLTTLYSFCSQSGCTDGSGPYAGLIQATDGNLYGTTNHGGANGDGTVFKITPGGTLTTLYSFCSQTGCTDGSGLITGLVQATNGKFYGTTQAGGAHQNSGTIFSLSVGLGPFVETQTTSGKVGAAVKILGTNLAGATSVTFNGTAAVFTVNSTGSAISATVPSGATTGTVEVVTPRGRLMSNVPFRVLP
ncbi:MAG TPA: choice-of-anchor tandem repeat GloVer-containing protein [Bryobacteraceae bacterium]|nr:choice-of-anchor tandem repeat GloVer-containing protein [Bryobacteraceae bacterium]